MKAFILSSLFIGSVLCTKAQNGQVSSLPSGKYETVDKSNQNKWERGDIILLDQNRYKISTSDEIGEYKFSITAQRIFFISGPLKTLYARTSLSNDMPAIVLPVSENQSLKSSSDIWGYYKQ